MLSRKKFPLPRPGRKRSDDTTGGGVDGSERSGRSLGSSSSSRTRSFGRRPSFRFGRKKSNTSDAASSDGNVGPRDRYSVQCSPSAGSDAGSDVFFGVEEGEKVVIAPPPPLPLPMARKEEQAPLTVEGPSLSTNRSRSSAASISAAIGSRSESELAPPLPLTSTRTRSLTPSDRHYHTAPEGGCNAPLVPIDRHYETNEALRRLFSTLYERDEVSVAYAVGVKFVEVALFQIPQHGYYRSGSQSRKRLRSAADAVEVTRLLGEMVDEMEEEESGGLERVERLQKLARAAHESYEEAVDDESKLDHETSNRDKSATSQMSRMRDYLLGIGAGAENDLCALPDNLCSFWSVGRDGTSRYDVDDTMMEDCAEGEHAKKRMRVDRESLPVSPEPVLLPVLPQIFIKKESISESAELGERGAWTSDASDVNATNPASLASAGDLEAKREEASVTRPMEVDFPATALSGSEQAPVSNEPRGESPPSVLTEHVEDAAMEDTPLVVTQPENEPAGVVKGRPVEQPVMDRDGFDKDALQLSLSLSVSMQDEGVPVVSSSSEDIPITVTASHEETGKTASLCSQYQEEYHFLRDKDKFHVRFLDTFQGRNPKSTNGCTVIAPLTCIQYFTSREVNNISTHESTWNNGVPDDLINQVIDVQAATILPEVRGKLNLEEDAFIIPSDVHDHLIDVGLLSTAQFVGVCGGNILDDNHLASFKSSLLLLDDERERERLKGRKIGATFFFHGHVVALHIVDGSDGNVWIELIDSLPNPETWIKRQLPTVSPESSDSDEQGLSEPKLLWSEDSDEWEHGAEIDDGKLPLNAVRIRCTAEHFDTLIRRYALEKFSKEERAFIDTTVWDDNSGYCESSFDPRVFQAFIWCEAE